MANNILKIIPIAQSSALAADNLDFMHKKDKGVKDFTKQGVKNIVGASLINETANFI